MQALPIVIELVLGVVEYIVINKALREWSGSKSWVLALLAAAATCVPALGGALGLVGAIAVLQWPWWVAGGVFVGGSAALAVTGGIATLVDPAALF